MDYEKKLALAKEALDSGFYDKETIEYIFPELKEIDGEKIRKEIIAFLTYYHTGQGNSVKYDDDWIAWLEKQGEQKFVDNLTPQEAMDIAVEKCFEEGEQKPTYTKEYDFHGTKFIPKFAKRDIIKDKKCGEVSTIEDFSYDTGLYTHTYGQFPITIQDDYELVEQNPDNVEPKFKVGDCIKKIGIGYESWVITDIDKMRNEYEGRYEEGYSTSLSFFEQDNFELVEQKPADEVGNYNHKEVIQTIINEQKPTAWNEEDEHFRLMTLGALVTCKTEFPTNNVDEQIRWIKSLKDRFIPQHQQKWSNEDEEIKNIVSGAVDLLYDHNICFENKSKSDCMSWLNLLKERVVPQSKQEWSDEDKKKLNLALYFLNELKQNAPEEFETYGKRLSKKDYEDVVNWLRSLRPQNTWKPSDEQMEVLLSEVKGWTKGCPKQIVLESLYQDLKKL